MASTSSTGKQVATQRPLSYCCAAFRRHPVNLTRLFRCSPLTITSWPLTFRVSGRVRLLHRRRIHDPSFIAAGAESFKRDLPDAEVYLLDAGHFALDERTDEIASLIL